MPLYLEGEIGMSIQKIQVGDKAQDFDFQTPWLSQQNFYETMGNNPAILVFLRSGLPSLSDGDGSSKARDWTVHTKGKQSVCFPAKLP